MRRLLCWFGIHTRPKFIPSHVEEEWDSEWHRPVRVCVPGRTVCEVCGRILYAPP